MSKRSAPSQPAIQAKPSAGFGSASVPGDTTNGAAQMSQG